MDSLLSNAQRCARKADSLVRYGQYDEALSQLDKSIAYLNELKSVNSRYELIQMLNVQIDSIDRKMRSVAIKRSESIKKQQDLERNQHLSKFNPNNNPKSDTLLVQIVKNDLIDLSKNEYLKIELMDHKHHGHSKRYHNNNSNGIDEDDLDSEILNEESFHDAENEDDDVEFLISNLATQNKIIKANNISSSTSSSNQSSSNTTSTLSYSSSSVSSINNSNGTSNDTFNKETEAPKSDIIYNRIDLSKYIQEDEEDDEEQVLVDLDKQDVIENFNKKTLFNKKFDKPPNEFILD